MKYALMFCLIMMACQKSEVSSTPQPDKNFAHPEIIGTWVLDKVQTINCGTDVGTSSYPDNDYRYFSNYKSDKGWYYCDQQNMIESSQQFKIIGDSLYYRYANADYPYSSYFKLNNDSLILTTAIGILIQNGHTFHCSDKSFAYKK
ncbi:MAG TPA: hypothetical protein DGG95_07805 [Cytophagales bacterium]|jgi:hypothetical protein|nr:hypothetical protein [Cytophagales bacterium]